jgi:hypothetical protein
MTTFTDEELQDRCLEDGIYKVPEDVEVLLLTTCEGWFAVNDCVEAEPFIAAHPDLVIASAYETGTTFLLSRRVEIADCVGENWVGSGFNYGSTNLLSNCPARLLILAQND